MEACQLKAHHNLRLSASVAKKPMPSFSGTAAMFSTSATTKLMSPRKYDFESRKLWNLFELWKL